MFNERQIPWRCFRQVEWVVFLYRTEFASLFTDRDVRRENLTVLTLNQRTIHDMSAWSESMDGERDELTAHVRIILQLSIECYLVGHVVNIVSLLIMFHSSSHWLKKSANSCESLATGRTSLTLPPANLTSARTRTTRSLKLTIACATSASMSRTWAAARSFSILSGRLTSSSVSCQTTQTWSWFWKFENTHHVGV